VGKSFAYLVPAILASAAGGKDCRVVISTHTISLQEQLVRKDIPFLQTVMSQDVSAVLVKGRSNYLSLRRLRGAQQRPVALLAVRRQGASLLPDYKVVILDAAHTLEDVAADHLGIQVGRGSLDYLLNRLFHPRNRRGLLACIPAPESACQVEATRHAADQFFK